MTRFLTVAFMMLGVYLIGTAAVAEIKSSEAEFKEHCAMCHPDGGNIMNPQKTLSKKDRSLHKIVTEADIIKIMRNPGPGMTRFDEKTVSDKEAKTIADYIIKTFK